MITIQDIRDAAGRIAPYINWAPVLTSRTINERMGAFNTISQLLDEEKGRGSWFIPAITTFNGGVGVPSRCEWT